MAVNRVAAEKRASDFLDSSGEKFRLPALRRRSKISSWTREDSALMS